MITAAKNTPKEASSLISLNKKSQTLGLLLFFLLILLICVTANMGEAKISISQIARVILGKLIGKPELYADISGGFVSIIWDIRLPRILASVFVGAGLSIAGAVFQSLLMNPLADPYTLGISTGAAFGASLSIYFSAILGIYFLPVLPAAFIFAIITLILVSLIANRSSGLSRARVRHRPRLLSDNGPAYLSAALAKYIKRKDMEHVRGAPYHPMTQGKIERWHRTMKNVVKLENYYSPEELTAAIARFVDYYNQERYHESLDNMTPSDIYYGRAEEVKTRRDKIKKRTLLERKRLHRLQFEGV